MITPKCPVCLTGLHQYWQRCVRGEWGWVCGRSRQGSDGLLQLAGPSSLSWATVWRHIMEYTIQRPKPDKPECCYTRANSRPVCKASVFVGICFTHTCFANLSRGADFIRIRSWCYGHYMSAWRSQPGWIEHGSNVIWALSTTLPWGRVRPSLSLSFLYLSYIKGLELCQNLICTLSVVPLLLSFTHSHKRRPQG